MRTLFLFFALMLTSGAAARDFRICVDANDWSPYTHPDRDGDLQSLVRRAAARQGDSVTFIALPWLRCESVLLGSGLDGLLGEPWSVRSRDKFAFPLSGEDADTTRAAAGIEVVLARRADSPAAWDGHALTGLRGTVAYVQGDYEIAARLDALGIPNSDDYHSDAQTLKALLAGRTNVAILFPDAARRVAEAPDYKDKIKVMTPPFALIFYYLAFAKPVYAANRDAIEKLWRTVAEIRVGDVDPADGGGIVSPRTNGEQW